MVTLKKFISSLLIVLLTFFDLFLFSKVGKAQFSGEFGSISGTITWGTETTTSGFKMRFVGNNTGFNLLVGPFEISTNTGFVLPPDTYTVTAYRWQNNAPDALELTTLATQSVIVGARQSVNVNFDLLNTMGFVKGNLKINSNPAGGYVQFCSPVAADPCPVASSGGYPFDVANGPWEVFSSEFRIPVPPGDYRVHVSTNDHLDAGIIPITVNAGEIVVKSPLQFEINLGSISGTIFWGNEILTTQFKLRFVGNFTGFNLLKGPFTESTNTGFVLPPDTYTVTAYRWQNNAPDALELTPVGSQTVVVGSGQSASVNFDLSGTMGFVKGNLKVNSNPSSGHVQLCSSQVADPCPVATSGGYPFDVANGPWEVFSSEFRIPVFPGDYRVHVATNNYLDVGIIPITATAGQVVSGSPLDYQINLGSITGAIKWGAETPTSRFKMRFVGNSSGFNLISGNFSSSTNTGFVLPPDVYTVTAYQWQNNAPDALELTTLATQSVTVGPGQAASVNFNLSNNTGFVKGNLKINDNPAGGYVQFCSPMVTDPCPIISFGGYPFDVAYGRWEVFSSEFRIPVFPGDYRVHVATLNGVDMGIVSITVTVGDILDLTTTAVNVPVGQNVNVSLAGVTVTFSDVTASGFMTITTTTHPQGGLPPSLYRFLGTYYELTTTATYTGPVTVSFTYDDADVRGREENLKLFHWDGVEWVNITVSVDTVNNVITGVTPTLSPFAIGDLLNSPPTVDAGGPYSVDEEGMVQVTATGQDPENGPLTYAWDLDNNGSFETLGQAVEFSAAGLDGPSSQTIAVQATDVGGLTASAPSTVTVLNVAPSVGEIAAPIDPVLVNTTVNASADFTDPGELDTHTAVWDWGDKTSSAGVVTETNGSGSVTGGHSYPTPGVYPVKLTAIDDDGGSSESVFQFVVVYNPEGGFVTGGGWIDSPSGAYPANPSLTGRANFGFVSKYRHGASVPTGQTQFQFRAATFNFHSTSYDWLVVAGPNAKYKGSGTINGSGDYVLMLTAVDGQVNGGGGADKFRIKIWDKTTNAVIYNNELGAADDAEATTAIGGGSIVIHR